MRKHRFSSRVLFAVPWALAGLLVPGAWVAPAQGPASYKTCQTGDAVLDWNAALLQANANDFDPAVVHPPDQKGPTGTSRALRDRPRGDL